MFNNSFGSTSFGNNTFGTGFGAAPTIGAPVPIGTTITFNPPSGTDSIQKTGAGSTQISTRHQNISAMKEYESKSVDELRLEDYAANRKIGQPQNTFNSTPFSSIQPSTSQQNTSIFGTNAQSAPNLFATPAQSQFNIFGQSKAGFELNNTSNIFNSSLNKPNTTVSSSPFSIGGQFNTNTTTAGSQPGFSLFNNNSQTTATTFGTSAASSPFKPNIFATPSPSTGFSAQTNTTTQPQGFGTTTSIFGSTTNNPPLNSTLFTTPQKTAFELNNSSGAGIFSTLNKPATTVANASPFQINTDLSSTPNIFNSSLNKPNTTVSNSSFSIGGQFNTNTTTAGSQPGFSLFNNNSQTTATTFGTSAASSPFKPNIFATPSPSTGFSAQTNTTTQPQGFGTTTSIFGSTTNNPPLNSTLFATPQKSAFELNNSSGAGIFSTLNKPATTVANASPFQIGSANNTGPFSSLSSTLNFGMPTTSTSSLFAGANPLQNAQPIPNSVQNTPSTTNIQQGPELILNRLKTLPYGEASLFQNDYSGSNSGLGSLKFTTDPKTINQYKMNAKTRVRLNKPTSSEKSGANSVLFDGLDDNTNEDLRCAIDVFVPRKSIKDLEIKSDLQINDSDGFCSFKSGVINSRPDYLIKPTLEEIEKHYKSESDTCFVDSLFIERPNYGSISFAYPLDVKGLNLDEIVHIKRKEVVVYPDDENKPPVGQGLNRPAVITLHQVWPTDKSNNEVIKDIDRLNLMKYPEKIEAATIDKGARFIEYRPKTGSWVFAVNHFSKYAITADDEEAGQTTSLFKVNSANNSNHTSNISSTLDFGSPAVSSTSSIVNASLTQNIQPLSNSEHNLFAGNLQQNSNSSEHLLNRLKTLPHGETSLFSKDYNGSNSCISPFKFTNDSKAINHYKMSAKTNIILNKPTSSEKSGPKRHALQNISPNISSGSYDRPIIIGATVPKQQMMREIRLKPDLHAARNKLSRDIMSMSAAGAPKVRFFNGSRNFCCIQGDKVVIHEMKLIPTSSDGSLIDTIKNKFEVFLEQNSLVIPLNMNPMLAPYIETNDFIQNASSHDLLNALYGNLTSRTPYAKQDERLTRVINWLASYNQKLPAPTNLYQLIIYHMSCDRYDLASTIAIENNHPRLALLVSTLNLDKDLMFEQLSTWRLSTADRYIDPEHLKIYVLLSGLTEWKLSNDITIYCLKGLKWTQQLCLLSLHVTSFISEPDKYGFHLLPLYIKRLDTNTNDVDYHIIARHSPANILSAAESLVDEWFLLESLKSFHVINSESECINLDVIHCNLASQLGSIDIRWACFVALHIINNEVRNQVLVKCLEQNQNLSIPIITWLVEKLKVPQELIGNCYMH